MSLVLGFLPLIAWLYLVLGRGFFWLARERDDKDAPRPATWPSVVAVVPARNEADVIARTVGSLKAQNYAGEFRVILVDDQSSDGTGEAARALGCEVISGAPRPPGWTGKLWAVSQGIAAAGTPDYLWLTDADIAHTPDNLAKLVARAEAGGLVLTSLMAKLHCKSVAEKLLIPAFVFFFDMLFPFGWVNGKGKTAAAAGGCMLVRRGALERAGGIDAISGEIIDDCALGRAMKRQGPIWLGLTDRAVSIRPYDGFDEIRRMVARSAYAQLSYSPFQLLGTVLGLVVVYAAAPFVAVFARGPAQAAGFAAWLLMAVAFGPMLRFYRLPPFWGLALPLIGALYGAFTLDSAIQHWRGRGGMWKGRVQAMEKA
jgi:hopene-associated glycosyltransferase HpnB